MLTLESLWVLNCAATYVISKVLLMWSPDSPLMRRHLINHLPWPIWATDPEPVCLSILVKIIWSADLSNLWIGPFWADRKKWVLLLHYFWTKSAMILLSSASPQNCFSKNFNFIPLGQWMIAQMAERLLCIRQTQVQIPALTPYEIIL